MSVAIFKSNKISLRLKVRFPYYKVDALKILNLFYFLS